MEDALLDMSQDELIIKETQRGDSPATFSRNLVDCFKIIGHNNQTSCETINSTDNNMTNDEGNPSTSDVVSSRDKAIEAIEHYLTVPLRQTLRDKSRASAKCDFLLRICLACNSFPKGVTLKVPLKVQDAPAILQRKWNDILQECSKQLTLQLVQFHQEQIVQFEQRAEAIITDASHHLLPEYITNVPNILNMIESTIEEQQTSLHLNTIPYTKTYHQRSTTCQVFGVIIDQHLTWNEHTSYVSSKANKVKCFLQHNVKPCPTTVKTLCYNSLIRSILDYTSIIWSPYTQNNIQSVESVQRKGCQICQQ